MLIENTNSAASTAPANVGLAAFQIAVVQAKVFRKTLEDVNDRADQTASELEQKSEEAQRQLRERLAEARGGVDVVVDGSDPPPADSANASGAGNQSRSAGGGVDITV